MDKKKALKMVIAEFKVRIFEVDQWLAELKEIRERMDDPEAVQELDVEISGMEELRGEYLSDLADTNALLENMFGTPRKEPDILDSKN